MKTYKEFREATNRAQQAAIAIAKKKSGKYDKDGNRIKEAQGPCWDGYEMQGMKKKGDKMVPNCVPVNEDQEYSMVRSELATVINAARRLQKKFGSYLRVRFHQNQVITQFYKTVCSKMANSTFTGCNVITICKRPPI